MRTFGSALLITSYCWCLLSQYTLWSTTSLITIFAHWRIKLNTNACIYLYQQFSSTQQSCVLASCVLPLHIWWSSMEYLIIAEDCGKGSKVPLLPCRFWAMLLSLTVILCEALYALENTPAIHLQWYIAGVYWQSLLHHDLVMEPLWSFWESLGLLRTQLETLIQ